MTPVLTLSAGTCGLARGAREVVDAAVRYRLERDLQDRFRIKVTGCHGLCEAEPNAVVMIEDRRIFYAHLRPEHIPEIVERTVLGGEVIPDFLYRDPVTNTTYPDMEQIPFYRNQKRLLLEGNLHVDPRDINDYLRRGGYRSLTKVIREMKPEAVIDTVTRAGLRGRGGAGFPTGRKWALCREQRANIRYVIGNADEGDPGAYMDRSLLEGNPHLVLEGMIIGGYAIGAAEGVIYVRDEYPLAVENIGLAIKQARQHGFLGKSVLGSHFHFELRVVRGAGAFVCGEETALIASIEGKTGRPRPRPPFPAQCGLWGKPTNVNNVETWANVPVIIEQGAEEYAKIGSATSKGTKIFSLVGHIRNTGLVEVPMGTTFRQIVFDIGGGVPAGREFKAVLTGGPAGGCITKDQLDLPVDYDTLAQAGAIMGSGGMIVMDDTSCLVDVARYFVHFTQEESCGKCVPCRLGTKAMVDILTGITKGQGQVSDLDRLEELAENVRLASLCGLGHNAPNPVITTLRHFRSEYLAHIKEKRCPALVCKDLISYIIDPELCTGCGLCARACPVKAIQGELKKPHRILIQACIKCGMCVAACPLKVKAPRRISPVVPADAGEQ